MNKKIGFIFFVLVLVCIGGLFAEDRAANIKNNWISGELSLLGVGARYERMLNSNLSVGANVYWSSFFFLYNELGLDASVRFYPWGKTFFAGIALGFHTHTGISNTGETDAYGNEFVESILINGVAITPELGWKIDVGKEGGFYLQPGIKVPITLGEKTGFILATDDEGAFGVGVGFVPYFGMGFAF